MVETSSRNHVTMVETSSRNHVTMVETSIALLTIARNYYSEFMSDAHICSREISNVVQYTNHRKKFIPIHAKLTEI